MKNNLKQEKELNFHKEIYQLTKITGSPENFRLWFNDFETYLQIRDRMPFSEIENTLKHTLEQQFLN